MGDEKKDNSSKVVEARSKFQSLLLNTIRFAARSKDHIAIKLSHQVCCYILRSYCIANYQDDPCEQEDQKHLLCLVCISRPGG